MTHFKTLIAGLLATAAIATAGSAAAATNLITNGDFEGGNNDFYSSYGFSPGDLWPEGVYDIVTNPQADHSLFTPFGDHTTGESNMMGINGKGTEHAVIWGQDNISLTANTDYVFSFWLASEHPASPAILRLNINGDAIGDAFHATATTGVWNNFTVAFNSGSTTTGSFALWNENLDAYGNDFALDDISLSSAGVPEPATWAMMLTGFFGMGSILRRNRRQLAFAAI